MRPERDEEREYHEEELAELRKALNEEGENPQFTRPPNVDDKSELQNQLSVMRASTETYKQQCELLKKKLNKKGMNDKAIAKYLDKEIEKYHKEIEKHL